ncbi:MAG: aldo/keto reductase [Firmicutes bacterium]|nr:aldo/keto reductase [Bacillota bacterium]
MRIDKMSDKQIDAFLDAYLEEGVNLFDHADIYGKGASEEVFGKALARNKGLRDKIILQTKCGIIPGVMYDLSERHILESVNGSLKRLNVDSVDILLLHRPDTLMEPEEVQSAFTKLYESGKVKHFGVSNQTPSQISFLQKNISFPLKINQLQFSAAHTGMINRGMLANTLFDGATDRDGGILEYCRRSDITIQAWSPFGHGFFDGIFIGSEKYAELNAGLEELAEKYNSTKAGIATAFILRHPANFQVITGTTKPERIKEICAASEIELERKDWYRLYIAAGNPLI